MNGYHANIEELTVENRFYRKVLYTGKHLQLVLMSLLPNEEIGLEIHAKNDQFFRFEAGEGKVLIDGVEVSVKDGDVVIVPAGAEHNIINTSDDKDLRLYTVYAPPNHPDGIMFLHRDEAEEAEKHYPEDLH